VGTKCTGYELRKVPKKTRYEMYWVRNVLDPHCISNWRSKREYEKFGCSEELHSQMHINNHGIARFTVQIPSMEKSGCVDCLLACLEGNGDELTIM
jgi:hypothetical protein